CLPHRPTGSPGRHLSLSTLKVGAAGTGMKRNSKQKEADSEQFFHDWSILLLEVVRNNNQLRPHRLASENIHKSHYRLPAVSSRMKWRKKTARCLAIS
ncbi:hypothetical protein TGGT1_230205, partial [Toxoplasma gondii GT1]